MAVRYNQARMSQTDSNPFRLLEDLNRIGIALSAERDHARLLEMILEQAQWVTNADGGTLYLVTEDHKLRFEIMHTRSLGIHLGGKSGAPIQLPPIELYARDGARNLRMVAARAATGRETINIADVYAASEFDFSGTLEFDQRTGYRSQSFLTVPMTNHENEVIGVLQLLNAREVASGAVTAFSPLDQRVVESLASQAAVAITNKLLIDAQRELFDSLIKLIADAIDEKSPYTAGHCRRVPVLTELLADAACATQIGPLSAFTMTADERYELNVAAWLHDCGKITTPEWVIDKSTKLEKMFDRIEVIALRVELMKREAELEALRGAAGGTSEAVRAALTVRLDSLDQDLAFLRRVNIGGETLHPEDESRLRALAGRPHFHDGVSRPLLDHDELTNLLITRGTLTRAEREVIANHVSVTIKMLESLPYPRHLRRVPEYAGGHHERMDGTGYPRGLTREAMSVPARMMAIADVFEALTARDRPYKKPMSLSQALTILGRMRLENHIDGDLFDVFVREKVYLRYAEQYLEPEQIDHVDEARIPGYRPQPV